MKSALAASALLLSSTFAFAQTRPQPARVGIDHTVNPEVVSILSGSGVWIPWGSVDTTTNTFIPIAGSGGTFNSWVPDTSTPLYNPSVPTTSSNGALPASPTVLINNQGAFPIIVKFTNSNTDVVSPGTSQDTIPPGATHALGTQGYLYVAYAAVGGTSAMQISGGSGLFAGAGGGTSTSSSSTSAGGFTPSYSYSTPTAVTNVSTPIAMPAGVATGMTVRIYNRGPNPIFYTAGSGTPVATASDTLLVPGCWDAITVPAGTNSLAAITSFTGATATVNMELGTGVPHGGCGPNLVATFGATYPTTGAAVGAQKNGGGTLSPLFEDVNSNLLIGAQASAFQAGSFVAAALADGAITTMGTEADVAWASGNGTLVSILKKIATNTSSITATFSQFAPNGTTYAPLVLTASSTSVNVAITGAPATITVDNVGANPAFINLGVGAGTVANAQDLYIPPGGFKCLGVGANTYLAGFQTAGSTTLNINAGAGGCAGAGGGGGGSSSASADTPIVSAGGPITVANVFGTGLTVQAWKNGGTVLSGTPTAGSAITFGGLSGWNSGYLECNGTAAATNWYEVDKTGGSAGVVWQRMDAFSGGYYSRMFNLTAVQSINVVADQFVSGTLPCFLRVSVNLARMDETDGPVKANNSFFFNGATIANTTLVAAVPGLSVFVTGWDEGVDSSAGGTAIWQFGYGSTCTSPTPVSALRSFTANNGFTRGGSVGQLFSVPPGNALCLMQTAAQPVTLDGTYVQK